MKISSPIKRAEWLKPVSREHHHGLLLCWKIKTGLQKEIDPTRIKSYTDWFYETYLVPHFKLEEETIFTILGEENKLIKQATAEHLVLHELFNTDEHLQFTLELIKLGLENHIRFEERVLFKEIQKVATPEQIKAFAELESKQVFEENMDDPFWE